MDRRPNFCWLNVFHRKLLVVGFSVAILYSSKLSAQVVPQPVEATAEPAVAQPVASDTQADDLSPSDAGAKPAAPAAEEQAPENEPQVVAAPEAGTDADPGVTTSVQTAPDQGEVAPDAPVENAPAKAAPAIPSATDPGSRELQNIIMAARAQLAPDSLPKVEIARNAVQQAVDQLRNYLTTNPASMEAWSNFLRLDEIVTEAAKEKPDANTLVDLEMNMRQNYLGLELQPFTNLRDSLVNLVRAVRYGTTPEQTVKVLDARLERLVESLNEPLTDSDTSRAESVGLIASYLHESGQVPWAVAAIHAQFSHPNVEAYIPESFLNRYLGRHVSQPSPVNECLLGTRVVGNACLNGAVTADLLPSANGIALALKLNATMTSNNVGYNRGVVLTSVGSSPVYAMKLVHISPNGISSQATTVSTHLHSQITSIQHPSRIVRKIATRKAAESQPQANAIAEGRLQTRVRTQFDEQVETQLAETRTRLANFQQKPRPEFQRIGLARPPYSLTSTSDLIYGVLKQSAGHQLAATGPSSLPRNPNDATIEAHQSAVMNTIDTFFGGRTLRNEDLDDLVRQLGAEVSDELAEESKSQTWSITFATFHPVQVEFDDGLAKLTLRISQMTRGDQALKQPATITASYRPNYNGGNLRLERQGDVDIEFVGRSSGLGAVSMRAFLKGKFDEFFKPVLVDKPIVFGEKMPGLRNLQISSIILDNGWLQVGVR
jgi:hypothetical protein